MSLMFYECSSVTQLDVSGFDTGKVEDMRSMFEECSKLKSIDTSNFNTSQVENMSCMFSGCSELTSLDLSKFDLSKIEYNTNGLEPITSCTNLTKVIAPAKVWFNIDLPDISGYEWKDANNNVCQSFTQNLPTSMTYVRVAKSNADSTTDKDNTQNKDQGTKEPAKPTAKPTPKPVGTQFTDTWGRYTVIDNNITTPVVSFDGVANENIKETTIPATITFEGITYTVNNVSIKNFEMSSAKYNVTNNSVNNLTVEYAGTTAPNKKSITIPETVIYKGIKFKVTSIKEKALKGNKKVTKIKVPSSVVKIGNSAFEGCKKLNNVTIGTKLETIGKNTFRNCKKMSKITIKSKKLKSVGKNALKGVHAKC